MQDTTIGKKAYTSPSIAMIGTLADDTKTGWRWRKENGPGDQFWFTDPSTCWDGHFYSNCQETSA